MAMKHFDGSDRKPKPGKRELIHGAFVEFLAMTLFVYFGCGAAASNLDGTSVVSSTTIIALQFGLAITVLAYATAHTSGGHINCAVTLALTIVGECHHYKALAYLVAQLAGSVFGALLLKLTTKDDATADGIDRTNGLGANGLALNVTEGMALLGEVMGTALLCFVVLETAVNTKAVTTEQGGKSSLAPIAIGLAVFMAHVVLIPITGCSINPTRSFGPALVANEWDDHWIWWAGPCAGAVVASLVWKALKMLEDPKLTMTQASV